MIKIFLVILVNLINIRKFSWMINFTRHNTNHLIFITTLKKSIPRTSSNKYQLPVQITATSISISNPIRFASCCPLPHSIELFSSFKIYCIAITTHHLSIYVSASSLYSLWGYDDAHNIMRVICVYLRHTKHHRNTHCPRVK